jgi:hypothetical protein
MYRLRLKARFARRRLHQLRGVRQIEIDQLSAIVADSVIVTVGFAIVAAGAVAKIDFVDQAGIFQVAQRVVNGCVADTGQTPARRLKDIAGRRVIVAFLNHLENRLSLGSQLRLLLGFFHDGLRLILIPTIVKGASSMGESGVATGVVDDAIDIAFEGRAVDVVPREQLLRLAGIVVLLHEKIRDGVVRQARDARRRRQH